MPVLKSFVIATQCGSGLNGGETALAHLQLRICFTFAGMREVEFPRKVIDIKCAFASLSDPL